MFQSHVRSFKTIQRLLKRLIRTVFLRAVSDSGYRISFVFQLRSSAVFSPDRLYRSSFFSASLLSRSVMFDLGLIPHSRSESLLPRKEVIQPHLPIRLPCYDFTPVISLTFDGCALAVHSPASGALNSHGVTGGVYKARERIHRGMLIRDY